MSVGDVLTPLFLKVCATHIGSFKDRREVALQHLDSNTEGSSLFKKQYNDGNAKDKYR